MIFNLSWEPCLCKLPNFLNLPFVFMEKNQECLCSQGQFTPPLYKSDSRPEKLALSTAHKENVRVSAHCSREIQKFQKKSPNSFLLFVRVIDTYIIKQLLRHLFLMTLAMYVHLCIYACIYIYVYACVYVCNI